jgi:hypothetical protein
MEIEELKLKVGTFHCDICEKDITVYLITRRPEILEEKKWRDIIIDDADNYHWYAAHYNCAVCGKWIPPGERQLIGEDDFKGKVHENYTPDRVIRGLLRLHSGCLKGLEI